MASKQKLVSLPLEDGLLPLPGADAEPSWIWVDTCHIVDCDCRSAVVLASNAGKDALLASAEAVQKALTKGRDLTDIQEQIGADCAGVELDIDSGQIAALGEEELSEALGRTPWLQSVVERIHGQVLDHIGRLWYRGKGQADPEQTPVHPREIRDWAPGDEVSWEEAYWGVRDDLYAFDDRLFEVSEFYCVMPGCDCDRVMLRIGEMGETEDRLVGSVTIEKDGECKVETDDGTREDLDRTWAAYQKRYPDYRKRHAARSLRMREFGEKLVEYHEEKSKPKVGQNDPCPCGSGKKYKKCCWKKTIGA